MQARTCSKTYSPLEPGCTYRGQFTGLSVHRVHQPLAAQTCGCAPCRVAFPASDLPGSPFQTLPNNVRMSVAIRRSPSIGLQVRTDVEDLGATEKITPSGARGRLCSPLTSNGRPHRRVGNPRCNYGLLRAQAARVCVF
jgi:hypothetical protein